MHYYIPVCTGEDAGDRVDGRLLVGVSLDANPLIVTNREQIVDHFEAVRSGRDIHAANVCDAVELRREGDEEGERFSRRILDLRSSSSSSLHPPTPFPPPPFPPPFPPPPFPSPFPPHLVNCPLVCSLRKEITGSTPSG